MLTPKFVDQKEKGEKPEQQSEQTTNRQNSIVEESFVRKDSASLNKKLKEQLD